MTSYPGINQHQVNERKARYTSLIDQFLTSERFYSGIVNRNYSMSDSKNIKFPSSDVTEITKILTEFLDSQGENLNSGIQYEELEEPCIKKSVKEEISSTGTSASSDVDDADDSLSTKTVKLHEPEIAITKMQRRRDSTSKISNFDKLKGYNFDEPTVVSIDNLDTDEESIVVAPLSRDETRESTGQSDVDVVIGNTLNENKSNPHENITFDSTMPFRGSLKRVYTVAGEADAKSILKNVTIDEAIKYIDPPDYEFNDGSLCLDDETAANIRHKMMAYSLSEADSDNFEGNNTEARFKKYDDFNISTALVDNDDTSTETESTIVSTVTEIQAGTGEKLLRKRADNSTKVSFGNAAINESLEHLVRDAAAKKIQKSYRQYYRTKIAKANVEDRSYSECTKSMENTLAQKRSIMLQRGDALQNGSSPEEGTSSSNGSGSENGKIISQTEDISCLSTNSVSELQSKSICANKGTLGCSLPSSGEFLNILKKKKQMLYIRMYFVKFS